MLMTTTKKYTTSQNKTYKRYRKNSYNVTWGSKEGKITFGWENSGM